MSANELQAAFERARARGEGALVAYAMAGDPDLPRSVDVFAACVEGGADILEIGVAFSDPIADGPVIQGASERALKAGSTLRRVLDEVVPAVRERCPQTPLVVMTYVNVIMALGEERIDLPCPARTSVAPRRPERSGSSSGATACPGLPRRRRAAKPSRCR